MITEAQIILITSHYNTYNIWNIRKGLVGTFSINRDDTDEQGGTFSIVSNDKIFEESTGTLYDFIQDKVIFQRESVSTFKDMISDNEMLLEENNKSIVWDIDTNTDTIFSSFLVKFYTNGRFFGIYDKELYVINGEMIKITSDISNIILINEYLIASCSKDYIQILHSQTFEKVTVIYLCDAKVRKIIHINSKFLILCYDKVYLNETLLWSNIIDIFNVPHKKQLCVLTYSRICLYYHEGYDQCCYSLSLTSFNNYSFRICYLQEEKEYCNLIFLQLCKYLCKQMSRIVKGFLIHE